MYHHRITYKPKPELTKGKAFFEAFCCVLVFGIIGCMLAWRG